MQAKCESFRKLIIAEFEKNKNGDAKVSHTDIARRFRIHPNTVGKYVRQSKALEPTIQDLRTCIDKVNDPRVYISQLNVSDQCMYELLNVHKSIQKRKAPKDGVHYVDNVNNEKWVSYSELWVKDDDTLDAKKLLIDIVKGRDRNLRSKSDLVEIIRKTGMGSPDQYVLDSPRINLSGDALMRALDAHYVMKNGRKAECANAGLRVYEGDTRWVTNGRCWIKDDELSSAKETLLQVGLNHMPVPRPKKGGGLVASTMRVSKQHKVYLSQILHSTTLSLLNAAEYIRVHVDSTFPVVSETTLYNIAQSMGLSKKRNSSFDPKKVGIMSKELEEKAFQLELHTQKGVLRGENLLFMDESNFYLNMGDESTMSWGLRGKPPPEEAMTKGKSQYLSLILTVGLIFDPRNNYGAKFSKNKVKSKNGIKRWKQFHQQSDHYTDLGVASTVVGGWNITGDPRIDDSVDNARRNLDAHLLVFWHIVPPTRKPHLQTLYEFNEPFTPEETEYWQKIKEQLLKQYPTDTDLKSNFDPAVNKNRKLVERVLFFLGIDSRALDGNNQIIADEMATNDVLKTRFLQVMINKNRETLPRRFVGARYKGGSPQPELSTTSKFMHYLRSLSAYTEACFGADVLEDSRIFLDNASTHGRVNVDSMAASFLHEYAKDLQFEGAVFPPSLSPKYNVAEVVFSYIKTLIRNAGLPPSGQHSIASMADAIEASLMQVTPAMVAAWTLSRGYRFDGAIASNQLPLGLFTQPIRSSTGETIFGTGKYTTKLRATGEIDAQALRLAYPQQPMEGEKEDNHEIVESELNMVNDLMHKVATLRFEYQDILLMRSPSPAIMKRYSIKIRSILSMFMQNLPLYSASYKEITKGHGEGSTTEKCLSLSQLDDYILVLSEVSKHYTKAVKSAKGSKQRLCSLGVQNACNTIDDGKGSTASVCARSFPARYNNLVCMNEMGQIAKSLRVSQGTRPPHRRFGAEMGQLNEILKQTARLVAIHRLKLKAKHILDLRPSSNNPLKGFAEQVVQYVQNGALRPDSDPCARVGAAQEGGSLVIVRDWNAWISIGSKDVSSEGIKRVVSLVEHGYPEYLVKDTPHFENNNKWGDMIIQIKSNDASVSSMLYSHVGIVTMERFRQIALSTMTTDQLKSLGADVLEIDVQKDPDVTFHLQTQSHLPLWIVEKLKDRLYTLSENPELLHDNDTSTDADMYSEVWNYFKEKAFSVKLSDVSPSSNEQRSCTIHPLSNTPRCFNFRKLRRLMLDMKFPTHVVKAFHFYSDVSQEGHMPLISASQIRNRNRWENHTTDGRMPEKMHRRWPGYPMVSYSDELLSVRDAKWVTGACTREFVSAQTEYKRHVDGDAISMLTPFIKELNYVFLHLDNYKTTFKNGDRVDKDLFNSIKKAKRLVSGGDHFKDLEGMIITKGTPIHKWGIDIVHRWNEFIHSQLNAQMPNEGVLLYPALLFLTVNEHRNLTNQNTINLMIDLFQSIHVAHKKDNFMYKDSEQVQTILEKLISPQKSYKDKYGSEWIIFIPDTALSSVKSRQMTPHIVSASRITLKRTLSHIESRLRLGMPWEFVRHTQIRPVPTIMENVVRVYEIDELSSLHTNAAIDALTKLYSYQTGEYMERNVTPIEKQFLIAVKRTIESTSKDVKSKVNAKKVDPKYGGRQFVAEFQSSLGKYPKKFTQSKLEFTFWPIGKTQAGEDDLTDYYIVESSDGKSGREYDVQYLHEMEDEWVKSLVEICKQRNSQRRSRVSKIPGNSQTPGPSVTAYGSTTAPAFRSSWLIVKSSSTADKDKVVLDALTLSGVNVFKQSTNFKLYQRDSAHDGSSPVTFKCISHQGKPLSSIIEDVPPPHLTSRDKITIRAYCTSTYASIELALHGLGAYGVEAPHRDQVCVIHHKQLWIPLALQSSQNRFPIIRVNRSTYSIMCFIMDGVSKTLWNLTIDEMQTLHIKSTFT